MAVAVTTRSWSRSSSASASCGHRDRAPAPASPPTRHRLAVRTHRPPSGPSWWGVTRPGGSAPSILREASSSAVAGHSRVPSSPPSSISSTDSALPCRTRTAHRPGRTRRERRPGGTRWEHRRRRPQETGRPRATGTRDPRRMLTGARGMAAGARRTTAGARRRGSRRTPAPCASPRTPASSAGGSSAPGCPRAPRRPPCSPRTAPSSDRWSSCRATPPFRDGTARSWT